MVCVKGFTELHSTTLSIFLSRFQHAVKKITGFLTTGLGGLDGCGHRVDRVQSFFSSRPNCDSPAHSTKASVYPPPSLLVPGGHTLLRERGWGGGPNSDEGTDTVELLVYMYFVGAGHSSRYPKELKKNKGEVVSFFRGGWLIFKTTVKMDHVVSCICV